MLADQLCAERTADVCDSWVRWPTATSAERWLVGASASEPVSIEAPSVRPPAIAGRALGSRNLACLRRAPRVRTGLGSAVPAAQRWLAALALLDRPAPGRSLVCAGGCRVRLMLLVADGRVLVHVELPLRASLIVEGGDEFGEGDVAALPVEVAILAASWQAALVEEVSRVNHRRQ